MVRVFKHNEKDLYVFSWAGIADLLWAENKELRSKRIDDSKMTNFEEISFKQFQRWRIHEVLWDGDYKQVGILMKLKKY